MGNTKLTKQYLIDEIKEELVAYFKRGIINPKSFFDIEDIRFSNLNDILKIHFILSDEVKCYVKNLEKNIRHMKNSTALESELFRGEVRGHIDWEKTIDYRLNHNYKDKAQFIGKTANKLISTKENRVLKAAIELISDITNIEIGMERFEKFDWFKDGEWLTDSITNLYKNNVYIQRIDKGHITDKMIEGVSKSRNKLYRESAILLKYYIKLMKRDAVELGKLFSTTFIDIEDEDRVFELYSIFKYLRDHFPRDKVKYNILDGNEECLAIIEYDDYRYEVYHDSTGRDDISFNIDKTEIEKSDNRFLKRKMSVLDGKSQIYNQLEQKNLSSSIWKGRPDLLIFKLLDGQIIEITIGEAKYTNNRSYMYRGLEELLEYMNYIKYKDCDISGDIKLKGILFVDDIDIIEKQFDNITIINRY